ncbi:MAG: tyrosine-type recombinase/integrase, partial [Candidatus Limnocylindrales bacterium]
MAQVEALLAAPDADSPTGIRDRALLELLYASGLRISEALGLDRQDLSLDGGFVRVIGKGDKERMVPVGDVALDALQRYIETVRPGWIGGDRGFACRVAATLATIPCASPPTPLASARAPRAPVDRTG